MVTKSLRAVVNIASRSRTPKISPAANVGFVWI
jgi:hypothetical protein